MRSALWLVWAIALAACGERAASVPVAAPTVRAPEAPASAPAESDAGARAWPWYTSAAGRFRVRLPEAPQEDVVESAPLTMHVVEAVSDADVVFAVAFTDYPEDFPASADPERLLDTARDALVAAPTGELVFERRATYGASTPARDVVVRKDGRVITGRLIAVATRVYELTVRASEGAAVDEDRDAFFDSFSLVSGR